MANKIDKKEKMNESSIKIVILQRGWVMVGEFERTENDCILNNASVIRRWGTTKGLGEIVDEGPTRNTVLDPTNGTVRFDYLTVVAMLDCNDEVWKKQLK
jgi:hypothetical protein